MAELQKRQASKGETMPLLDGEADLQIREKAYRKAKKALRQVEKQLAAHPLADVPDLADRLSALQRKHVCSPPQAHSFRRAGAHYATQPCTWARCI